MSDGVAALLRIAPQLAPRIEKLAWRGVYEIASLGRRDVVATMNYGYAPADGGVEDELERHDDRFGLQLYAEVAGAADLSGKDVLEVGCGRGGGASFVFDRFKPRSLTGMDLARSAIRRARARYERPGLTFVTASADNLPFPDASFDVVISIESTHCYQREMPYFLRETRRVLRPEGLLLLADLRLTAMDRSAAAQPSRRNVQDAQLLREQLVGCGFRICDEEDITPGVVRALTLNTPVMRARIERGFPKALQRHALEFAAVEGSANYRDFSEGRLTYLRFVLAPA